MARTPALAILQSVPTSEAGFWSKRKATNTNQPAQTPTGTGGGPVPAQLAPAAQPAANANGGPAPTQPAAPSVPVCLGKQEADSEGEDAATTDHVAFSKK